MSAAIWPTSTTNAFSTTLSAGITDVSTTIALTTVTGLSTSGGVVTIDRQDANNKDTPTVREYVSFAGVSGSSLTGCTRGLGGSTAQSHSSGAKVEEVWTITHWNDFLSSYQTEHNNDGTHADVTSAVSAASTTAAGKVELATIAETDTGTDTTRALTSDGLQGSKRNIRYIFVRVIGSGTDATAATTVAGDFESPMAGTIVSIGAYNDTAGVTGTATYDVNIAGTTIMTTDKISIETGEKSSRDATTQPTLTTTALAVGDILTFDIDTAQSGTEAKGLTFRIGVRED